MRAIRPDLTLDLIGDCGTTLGCVPEGVRRLGRLLDPAALLHRLSLAIALLRSRSGVIIKRLDYAGHGLWTIANPAALEGLAPDAQAPFIEAMQEDDFIRAILGALGTGCDDETALSYIAAHCGAARVFAPLDALIDAI